MNFVVPPDPPRNCPLCPRLVAYRGVNARENPDWFNGAAPSFGDPQARLLIVGLAPGRTGANRTGRPFTGDHACMVTNAVRCAPPGNKPLPVEEATCRPFLVSRLAALPRLRVIVTLGDVSRRNVLKALDLPVSAVAPGHGVEAPVRDYILLNSYHCSRLNTNTGRLTPEMFETVFRRARALIEG